MNCGDHCWYVRTRWLCEAHLLHHHNEMFSQTPCVGSLRPSTSSSSSSSSLSSPFILIFAWASSINDSICGWLLKVRQGTCLPQGLSHWSNEFPSLPILFDIILLLGWMTPFFIHDGFQFKCQSTISPTIIENVLFIGCIFCSVWKIKSYLKNMTTDRRSRDGVEAEANKARKPCPE